MQNNTMRMDSKGAQAGVPFGSAQGKPVLRGARMVLFALRAYQLFLGPHLGGACKFHPSCSHYAAEAVERFGPRAGLLLAVKRLLRCRPFSAGGWDPLPETRDEVGQASTPVQAETGCGERHSGQAVPKLREPVLRGAP